MGREPRGAGRVATSWRRCGAVLRRASARRLASGRRSAGAGSRHRRAVRRARRPSSASPASTCAATATSRSRSKPARRSSASRSSSDLVRDTVRAGALPRWRRMDRVGRGPDRPTGWRIGRPSLASPRNGVVRADPTRLRSRPAAHTRTHHSRLWARGLRCLASRTGAGHRTRVGRQGSRPGRGGATDSGSVTWRVRRIDTAESAANRSSPGATVCGNCGAAVEGTGPLTANEVTADTGADAAGAGSHGRHARSGAAGGAAAGAPRPEAPAAARAEYRPAARPKTTAGCRRVSGGSSRAGRSWRSCSSA